MTFPSYSVKTCITKLYIICLALICSRVDPMCFCAASKGVLVTIVENLLVAMAAKDGLEGTKTQIKQLATLLDFALRFDQQKVAARLSTHIQSYTKGHVRNTDRQTDSQAQLCSHTAI